MINGDRVGQRPQFFNFFQNRSDAILKCALIVIAIVSSIDLVSGLLGYVPSFTMYASISLFSVSVVVSCILFYKSRCQRSQNLPEDQAILAEKEGDPDQSGNTDLFSQALTSPKHTKDAGTRPEYEEVKLETQVNNLSTLDIIDTKSTALFNKDNPILKIAPQELWKYFFSFLPAKNLAQLSLVCKTFQILASDNQLWWSLAISEKITSSPFSPQYSWKARFSEIKLFSSNVFKYLKEHIVEIEQNSKIPPDKVQDDTSLYKMDLLKNYFNDCRCGMISDNDNKYICTRHEEYRIKISISKKEIEITHLPTQKVKIFKTVVPENEITALKTDGNYLVADGKDDCFYIWDLKGSLINKIPYKNRSYLSPFQLDGDNIYTILDEEFVCINIKSAAITPAFPWLNRPCLETDRIRNFHFNEFFLVTSSYLEINVWNINKKFHSCLDIYNIKRMILKGNLLFVLHEIGSSNGISVIDIPQQKIIYSAEYRERLSEKIFSEGNYFAYSAYCKNRKNNQYALSVVIYNLATTEAVKLKIDP